MLSVNPVTTLFVMIIKKESGGCEERKEIKWNFFEEVIILQCFMACKKNRVKSYQKLEALLLSGRKQQAVYN